MKKIISIVASVTQIVILISLVILNYFSNKSAGVNHHVIAKKYQWEATILNGSNLMMLSAILWIVIILLALIVTKQKCMNVSLKIEFIKLIISVIFIEASYKLTLFKNLNIMPYITLGALLIFVTQTTVVLIDILLQKKDIE